MQTELNIIYFLIWSLNTAITRGKKLLLLLYRHLFPGKITTVLFSPSLNRSKLATANGIAL